MIGIKDQYFGTEIEMTGITKQRAAEDVAEHGINFEVVYPRTLVPLDK